MSLISLFRRANNRYGLGALELFFASNWLNPFATLYLNFRSFSFCQAIKMPVWVYGHPRFYSLNGEMRIEGKVRSGMIKFNKTNLAPNNMGVQSEISNKGLIVFHGNCLIRTGNRLCIEFGKTLEIGENVIIADMINISCYCSIKIGANTRIAHRSQIMDSNFHYVANMNTRIVPPIQRPIIIGSYCWICNTSTITAGAVIPDNTIVTSNSLVNKNFSSVEPCSIIGGIPAKFIRSGFVLVNNANEVRKMNRFYSEVHEDDYAISDDQPASTLSSF